MPCRCCGASRPSKGFKEPGESKINELLKEAARLILDKEKYGYDDIEDWKKAWQEAFDHHLNVCKDNDMHKKPENFNTSEKHEQGFNR